MDNKIMITDQNGNLYDSVQASGVLDISDLKRKQIKRLAKQSAGWNGENGTFSWQDIASGQADVQGKFTRHEDLFRRNFNKQLKKNIHRTEQQAMLDAAKQGDAEAMGKYVASKRDDVAPAVGAVTVLPAAILAGLGTGAFAAGVQGLKSFYYGHPYLRTAMDIYGSIDGFKNAVSGDGIEKTARLIREGDTWGAVKSGIGDALDIAGMGDLAKTVSLFNKGNRALHAFNTISPISYDKPFTRFKNWVDDIMYERPVDIDNPKWSQKEAGELTGKWLYDRGVYSDKAIAEKIGGEARFDAWRMYNGLPQKYGTYVRNADGTYAYDLQRITDLDPNFKPHVSYKSDDVTAAGGGLTKDLTEFHKITALDDRIKLEGTRTIEDLWDLQPFIREDKRLNVQINKKLKEKFGSQKIRDAAQSFRRYMYDHGHWGSSKPTLVGKMTGFLDKPLNQYRTGLRTRWKTLQDGTIVADPTTISPTMDKIIDGITDNKISKFISDKTAPLEIGPIIGGKPFMMHTELPLIVEIPTAGRIHVRPEVIESAAFNPKVQKTIKVNTK